MGDVFDRAAVAALLGISPATVTRYLCHSRPGGRYTSHPFPAPDGRVGGGPWWDGGRRRELTEWAAARPGRGYRTDRSIVSGGM